MRIWGMLLACMLASAAHAGGLAQEVEYRKGEYGFSVGPEPDYVIPRELAAQWDARAPGADEAQWRYWLYEEQVDRRGRRDWVYTDYAYEPRATGTLGEAGRVQISFNPGYQRLVIHRVELRRDGRWQSRLAPERVSLARRETDFEQDMADGRVTALLVLDDLRVNDVVRVRYSIVGSNPVLAGQILDWNRLGWTGVLLDSGLRILYDPGTTPAVHRENGAPDPRVIRAADRSEVVVRAHGARAYLDEGDYPLGFRPYPAVQVAVQRGWADVVAWALPLYPAVDTLPNDLRAQVVAWNREADPYARATFALRAVQDEVRYFGVEIGDSTHRPAPPAETWNRRYGDCKDKAYLLVTLLRQLGLDAVPALLATEAGASVADLPPAGSVFDHVVVRVKAGGTTLWLDPTRTSEGGGIRASDLSVYGMALPIAPGVTALEAIAPPPAREWATEVVERYAIGEEGRDVAFRVETTYRGQAADNARRELAGQRPDALERRYADYYRKRFGELQSRAVEVHDDRPANVLTTTEHYVLAKPLQADGALQALEVYGEILSSPTSLPTTVDRAGPLYVGPPARYRHDVYVTTPSTWTARFENETTRLQSTAFEFSRVLDAKPGEAHLAFALDVGRRDLTATDVPAHIADLRRLRDELSARLRYGRPASLGASEREARLKALLRGSLEKDTTP